MSLIYAHGTAIHKYEYKISEKSNKSVLQVLTHVPRVSVFRRPPPPRRIIGNNRERTWNVEASNNVEFSYAIENRFNSDGNRKLLSRWVLRGGGRRSGERRRASGAGRKGWNGRGCVRLAHSPRCSASTTSFEFLISKPPCNYWINVNYDDALCSVAGGRGARGRDN